MTDVFKDIVSGIVIVKNNAGQAYIPSMSINTIGNWDYKQAYKVKTTGNGFFTMGCTKAAKSTPISLPAGWSMIGYLGDSPANIATQLSSLGNDLVLVKNNEGKTYIPSF